MNTVTADRAASAERALNTTIVNADITYGFEEYLAILDRYYAEDIAVSSDMSSEPLVGKERVKSALLRFLVPLHVMAEIGGLSVLVHETSIPSDSVDQQHSQWSVELVGVTGRSVRTTWCARRTWKQSRVVSEYHYAHRQDGEPLSLGDLHISVPSSPEAVKPS